MNPRYHSIPLCSNLILVTLIISLFCGCKKEELPVTRVAASKKSDIASDGIVSVQASILGATHQSFIPNGSTSTAVFEVVSSQHVFLLSASFAATCPLIELVVPEPAFPFPDNGGTCSGDFNEDVYRSQGIAIATEQHYLPVDSNTSGSVVHLSFQNLTYRTDDELYHTLYMGNKIKHKTCALVYSRLMV